MAGTLIVSNLTTDTDNTFIVRSNTGTTLFSANTTGIDVANSIGATAITSDKILSVANTKISGNIISSQIAPSVTLTTPIISGNLNLDSAGTTGIRVPSANTIAFHTAGTEDMRIDSSGNVGIGTSSPNGKFSVLGGAVGAVNFDFGNTTAQAVGAEARLRLQPSAIFSQTNPTLSPYISAIQTNASTSAADIALGSWSGTALIEIMRLQASGNLQFNSGYGSVATAYGCRAWVNFNGTGTVAIRASGNVSSITDGGTGNYTVNFTTAMPDVNYATSGSGRSPGTQSGAALQFDGYNTTSILFYTRGSTTGPEVDLSVITVAIFR